MARPARHRGRTSSSASQLPSHQGCPRRDRPSQSLTLFRHYGTFCPFERGSKQKLLVALNGRLIRRSAGPASLAEVGSLAFSDRRSILAGTRMFETISSVFKAIGDKSYEFSKGGTVSLAVSGLSRAGKTVFLTSLIANLRAATRPGPARVQMNEMECIKNGRLQFVRVGGDPRQQRPLFDFDRYWDAMTEVPACMATPDRGDCGGVANPSLRAQAAWTAPTAGAPPT